MTSQQQWVNARVLIIKGRQDNELRLVQLILANCTAPRAGVDRRYINIYLLFIIIITWIRLIRLEIRTENSLSDKTSNSVVLPFALFSPPGSRAAIIFLEGFFFFTSRTTDWAKEGLLEVYHEQHVTAWKDFFQWNALRIV